MIITIITTEKIWMMANKQTELVTEVVTEAEDGTEDGTEAEAQTLLTLNNKIC